MNLLELLITVVFLATLTASVFAPSEPTIGLSQHAASALDNTLFAAAASAQRIPDGVTVIVKPDGALGSIVTTYAGRPDAAQGYLVDQKTITQPISLPGAVTTFAFAVSPDGSAEVISPYTTWAAVAAGGAACTALTGTVGAGTIALPVTIDCASMRVTF